MIFWGFRALHKLYIIFYSSVLISFRNVFCEISVQNKLSVNYFLVLLNVSKMSETRQWQCSYRPRRVGELTAGLEDLRNKIPQIESSIEEATAEKEQLDADLVRESRGFIAKLDEFAKFRIVEKF